MVMVETNENVKGGRDSSMRIIIIEIRNVRLILYNGRLYHLRLKVKLRLIINTGLD